MQVRFTARHGHLNEATQESIREKAGKLTRFFDRLTSIDVAVDLEHTEKVDVEIRVSVEGHEDFVATSSAPQLMAAVDGTVHKLESQLKKYKERLHERRTPGGKHVELPVEEDDVDTGPTE